MKSSLKYGIAITIAAFAVSIVQFVCSFVGVDIDVNILIDVASVIVAILVVMGVVNRSETINTDDLKAQIKSDIEDKVEEILEDESLKEVAPPTKNIDKKDKSLSEKQNNSDKDQ